MSEKGVQAQITVLRSGVTNTSVSVQYATADGTGRAGTNYFAGDWNAHLRSRRHFHDLSGQYHGRPYITANHTVLLSLSNPQGGAILSSTAPSILTILEADGSFLIGAGTALVHESLQPTNGLIDPGETVTVDLALRCLSGGNTTNLVATLQTNRAVTPVDTVSLQPDVQAQTYGALTQGGPVVFAPFTFTANATNNQVINVALQLQDGPRNLQSVVFSFTVGTTTTTFSNNGVISIPATNFVPLPANGPAGPYPSTINVAGLVGNVDKVTVTINGLYHTLPSDIMMVLASPTTNALLMNDVGGDKGLGVTNFTVTIDDAAAYYMSVSNLVSGASTNNKPTPYIEFGQTTMFLGNNWGYLPVMPYPAPAAPYATNLSVFSGAPANGPWSLYVADNKAQDYGAISGGWSVNLSTGNPVPSYTDLELTVVPSPAPATVGNTN